MGSVWFCIWLIVWWFFSLFVLALNFRLSHKLQLFICGATSWIFVFLCPGNSWNQLKRVCSVNVLLGELRLPRLIPTVIMRFFYLIIRFFPIPKCGFLPFSRFIAEGNAIKKSVTRFRMHQILKLHQQEIAQISEYEPLDLFSGSKEKMHKAVKSLFTTPQNNFRVFLNGSLIYGGLGGGTDSTSFMVGEAFEDVLKCVIQAEVGMRVESFLHLVSETVSKSGVLDRLLEVQKLDIFDIEGAIHAYYDIVSEPCTVCRDLGEDIASHRYTSLHSIPSDESLKIVRDYLIAATAKDCSLMISFAPRKDGNSASPYSNVYLASTDQSFDYKAYFIDLDMKPLKKMQYYYELDQKIVSCYTQMMKTKHQPEKAASSGAYETTS
ncbi:inositol-pentakisphosphate 2-kinase-like isoform X3 [Vitis riparia]|uniref:inositol-pentakisphosphate 2-kinase-like isoform X3 n=1 Tax=Vitis riparia TaxID=96939 RepID=UPI00155A701E|nr:inositol-pentakisphosphate 2-kinase-like isoform X3 [Vitis riparia]